LRDLIVKAVEKLPGQCRLIFKLVREDGLRYKEVAELLHIQPKTVENQLAIAVRRLSEAVSKVSDISLTPPRKPVDSRGK
jgi:RNA polymerase sigma-70 factor (ECF subfamily)